jgi:DNA-binding NarL/FixJ family response regulator
LYRTVLAWDDVPSSVVEAVARAVAHLIQRMALVHSAPTTRPLLTPREREVLTWVARGRSAAEIAEILHITKRTVDEHVQTLVRKLGATNRANAVAIAIRDGLIEC